MADKMDILITNGLIKQIDIAAQRVEKRAKSCESRIF